MCRVFGVSRSGYQAWKNRQISKREQANKDLWPRIEQIIQRSKEALGYRQITVQLAQEGIKVSPNRVQRLLQRVGYRAVMSRRLRKRYKEDKFSVAVDNLLDRQFRPEKRDQVWASDITQIRCQEGWLYICVIMDLHSRAIIGWSQGRSPDAVLVQKALERAKLFSGLKNLDGVLFHSDQGSQYCSYRVRRWLTVRGATLSQSRRGNCWDNACVESFFSLMKLQWVYPAGMTTLKAMKKLVREYVNDFYNNWRVHGTVKQVPMDCYTMAT